MAGSEWVDRYNLCEPTMYESSPYDKERTDDDHTHRDARASDPDGDLPPEPNPEHPSHYRTEAHRTYKRLKSGRWTGNDLGARKWGLLAYWYPHTLTENGGSQA